MSALVFSRTAAQVTLFTQRCGFGPFLLAYSYSSAGIVLNMIKILFLQKFEVFFVFFFLFFFVFVFFIFVFSLFTSISAQGFCA